MANSAFRPGLAALAGACFVLLLAGGLTSNLVGVLVNQVPITRHPISLSAVLDGRVGRDVAGQIADTPLPSYAARIERAASWIAIGDLGPRVRQGCPGWLFLSDELAVQQNGEANAEARARTVERVARRLRAQGVDLLVVVVPDKSRIAAQHLCGVTRGPEFEARARDWVGRLAALGVPAIDLTPALEAPAPNASAADTFLRIDTHWNEAGADAAATAVAVRVSALDDAAAKLGPRITVTRDAGLPTLRPGDLVRLAGIEGLPLRWQPPQDRVTESRFVVTAADEAAMPMQQGATDAPMDLAKGRSSTPSQDSAADEAALFGNDALPTVALIGTSFSRTSNFLGFLQASLQARVANAARDGGEFAGAAAAYFASPAFKETPPRIVIWEIPERSLQRPLSGDPALE